MAPKIRLILVIVIFAFVFAFENGLVLGCSGGNGASKSGEESLAYGKGGKKFDLFQNIDKASWDI